MPYIRSLMMTALLLVFCVTVQPAMGSNDFKSIENTTPQEVVGGMSRKLVRGVSNIALGWWELPRQVKKTFQEDGVGMGLTVGPLKGIGMTLVRMLAGAGETLTFPAPYPGFYDPYFEPEFVWQEEK